MQPAHQHVFVHHPDGRFERLDPTGFEGFCRGGRTLWDVLVEGPTPHRSGVLRQAELLVITLRYDPGSRTPCPELIEPLRVSLDEHGYLCRLHIEPAPPVQSPEVVDLRPRLIRRYLHRTWQWSPSPEVIDAALFACQALQQQPNAFDYR